MLPAVSDKTVTTENRKWEYLHKINLKMKTVDNQDA